MATVRHILQIIENFQKSRANFARAIADLSTKPENVEILYNAGVMVLLRPLLLDSVPQIQQLSALGLGRLANYSEEVAEVVVKEKILAQILYPLREQNRYSKKAAANILKAVAKHSEKLAQAVVESGALDDLVHCLEEFDPSVKEVGAATLGNIARHTARLAQAVVDRRAINSLVLCMQEPEVALKCSSILTLADISKHTPELAAAVLEGGATSFLINLITHSDVKVKRVVCLCLSQIVKHTMDIAEAVVALDVFPKIFGCLKDPDPHLHKNAATFIREVVKHTPELAQLVAGAGGVVALVQNIVETYGNERLPGIMALGYIAAFDESLSSNVIAANAIPALLDALLNEHEDHIKSATAWALGQIGKHTPLHALPIAESGALPHLVSAFLNKTSSEDLQTKCKKALKAISEQLTYLPALDSLLQGPALPEGIMKYVLGSLAKILATDSDARAKFVTSGGFEKMQNLPAEPGSEIKEFVDLINNAFPVEIVHYYSPGYSQLLLEKMTGSKPPVSV